MKTMISIAKDFSESPMARYRHEGPNSGERFRDDYLLPALKRGEPVTVDLDGVVGFGSSFLEEAFGGLVRKGYRKEQLANSLKINASLTTYRDRVWRYIDDADKKVRRK